MMIKESRVYVCGCDGREWQRPLGALLKRTELARMLSAKRPVLIKPNLVETHKPPITTPVALVDALVGWLQETSPEIELIVGEGCGSLEYDTHHVFQELGYVEMAKRRGIELIDLNNEPCVKLKNSQCRRWPEMHLPEMIFECLLISVPVLKAHSLAKVTLSMKNMMGLAPPCHYQQGGHWKKAAFHQNIQEAVLDLNRYRRADFTVLDATLGMQEAHLWGPTCDPPPQKLAASSDPVAIDSYGCGLLGKSWQSVGHIAGAHNELGCADPISIIEADE